MESVKICMHLGDFHALMDITGAIGSYTSGSQCKQTLYVSGIYQPDFMSTVLSGKHYNHCWTL